MSEVESELSCRSEDGEAYIIKAKAKKELAPPNLLFGDLNYDNECFNELAQIDAFSKLMNRNQSEHSYSQNQCEQLANHEELPLSEEARICSEEVEGSSIPPVDHVLPEKKLTAEEFERENGEIPIQDESSSDLQKEGPREIARQIQEKISQDELHPVPQDQPHVEEIINSEPFASTSAIFRALQSEERRQLPPDSPPFHPLPFNPASLNALQQQLTSLISQISHDRLAATQFAQDLARSSQEKISAAIATKSANSHREILQQQRQIKRVLIELTKKMAESDKKVDRLDKKVEQVLALLRERKK